MANPVFISYSTLDKDVAERVCQYLEERGIACWMAPRDVPLGASWAGSIIDAIEEASAIVLVFSEHINNSEQVKNEVERAVNKHKPFFPIRLRQVMPSRELEYFISRWQWLDASTMPLDQVLEQLLAALRQSLFPAIPVTTGDTLRGSATAGAPESVLVFEASWNGATLELSAYERLSGEERAVKHYEHHAVDFAAMEQEVEELMALIDQAAQQPGKADTSTWEQICTRGAVLYEKLLTPAVRQRLKDSKATHMFLYLNDALVQIPWELLYDGEAFLCRRFSMGRFVSTQQTVVTERERTRGETLSMLIVANPTRDLEAASQEARSIQDHLATSMQSLQVDVSSTSVDVSYIKQHANEYDVLHYAGHADYDLEHPEQSSWRMAHGKLTAEEILQMGQEAPMPSLVFCNACESGQTTAWDIRPGVSQGIYGLANAFLLAGADHYIGTFWGVPDQQSSAFAIAFYQALGGGVGVGEALRRARQSLVAQYGEESLVWASYVLYGDPRTRYLAVDEVRSQRNGQATPVTPIGSDATPVQPATPPQRGWKLPAAIGAAALVVLVGAFIAFKVFSPGVSEVEATVTAAYNAMQQGDLPQAETLFLQLKEQPKPMWKGQGFAGLAAVALAQARPEQALTWADQAAQADPDNVYCQVIRGHVLFDQGKSPEAMSAYEAAIMKNHGAPWQRAIAANRLGRLYADQGQQDTALTYFDKAISYSADMPEVYANKGYVLAQRGQYSEAVTLYEQALQRQPDDRLATALLHDAKARQQLAADKERQARIDTLVNDLVQAYRDGRTTQVSPGDGWTSAPLTLAFLPFQRTGTPAPRAGEDDIVLQRAAEALRASGRVVMVERETLDALLAELKLGASELADPKAAVRIGKLFAARLLVAGGITRQGPELMLSPRLIETETSVLKGAATLTFPNAQDFDQLVTSVTETLLAQIHREYPLQGLIARVAEKEVILNIGKEQGVTPGLLLQVFVEEPIEVNGKVTPLRATVGQIKVKSVQEALAVAEVVEQSETLQQGWKVQEVVKQ